MKDYYLDRMILGMKPFGFVHKFGVNGKVAGNLAAIQEIEDVVPILYGPKGCTFHYKYSTRLRNKVLYDLESLDLQNKEIIFGAEDKLKELLLKVDRIDKPRAIFIIPTVVSDIINDDIDAVVRSMQSELNAKVIVIKSQVFSHMNKSNNRKLLAERANQSVNCRYNGNTMYKGCGYIEVMEALVNNIMRPQGKEAYSVNIESFIWGYGAVEKISRVKDYLYKMGIKVNCFLPAATMDQIEKSPRASLNIVRRKKWAVMMKEKFGTDFLHVADMQEWQGFDGIRDFYVEIGKKLQCEKRVTEFLEKEIEFYMPRYNQLKEKLTKYKYALISESISDIDTKIKLFYNYGIKLEKIFVLINPDFQNEHKISDEVLHKLFNKIEDAKLKYSCNAQVVINPELKDMDKYLNETDYIMCNLNPIYKKFGKPCILTFFDSPVFDFKSFIEIMEKIIMIIECCKNKKNKDELLLNRIEFNQYFYPIMKDDKLSLASREIYSRMWGARR